MALDWFAFLKQHNIPFTTTGPNASRGRVNVRCPFCGESDPSEHMGISLSGRGWSCWRNAGHRGRDAVRLVSALLRCTPDEAARLVGGEAALPEDHDLAADLRARVGDEFVPPTPRKVLTLPGECKSLDRNSVFTVPFKDYLAARGYRATQMDWLIKTYDLHYCIKGRWAYRIIIPIYDRWTRLQTWTARTILPDVDVRYKTLRKEEAVTPPTEMLLGLPLLWSAANPAVLLVCEGPFDAMWVTAFGRTFGVYATCLFGLSMSGEQAELLLGLQERFARTALLLDNAARFQAFRLAHSGLNLGVASLPENVKDPAELSADGVMDLCTRLLS